MYRLIRKAKIFYYIVLIVYQVFDACFDWYNFYVFYREKRFTGISVNSTRDIPVDVFFGLSCSTGTLFSVCMVVAYVYYTHYHRFCIDFASYPSASFKDGVVSMIRDNAFDDKFNPRYVQLELWGTVLELLFKDGIQTGLLFWMRKSLVRKPNWHFFAFAVCSVLAHLKQGICFILKLLGWGAGERRCCNYSCGKIFAGVIGVIASTVCLCFAVVFVVEAATV